MPIKTLALAAVFAAVPALAASSAPAVKSDDAVIHFANLGGINDWRADGDSTLYIQGRSRSDWYKATLMGPCTGLPFAQTVGFVSEPTGSFDKFSSIVVQGQTCQVQSLVKVAGPPASAKSKKR